MSSARKRVSIQRLATGKANILYKVYFLFPPTQSQALAQITPSQIL